MKISNKTYDFLKFLAQIVLPALATFVVTVGALFRWDFTEEVVGVIVAVDTFLGVLLGVASNTHAQKVAHVDGALRVIDTPDKATFQLSLDTAPEQLALQDRVVLKVSNVQDVVDPNLDSRRPGF